MEKLYIPLMGSLCAIVIYQERKDLKERLLIPLRKKRETLSFILLAILILTIADGKLKDLKNFPLISVGSSLGNGKVLIPIAVSGICLSSAFELKFIELALRKALISGIASGLIADVVKPLTCRARPRTGTKFDWFNYAKITDSDYWSFPSGHTALASGFFFCLYFNVKKKYRSLFLAIPFIVALSRVAVLAHWLSDVSFSLLLGFIIARGGED